IIPDELPLALLVIAPFYLFLAPSPSWLQALMGGAIMLILALTLRFGFFYCTGRQGLGLGDVKFMPVAGLLIGVGGLANFLLIAGITGVLTGIIWRLAGRGERFPFGPALALALFLCLSFPTLRDPYFLFADFFFSSFAIK